MKTKLFIATTLLLTASFIIKSEAQTINYVDSVIKFSSQYELYDWSAKQVLGFPDVYPWYGDSPNAWASKSADNQREYLELYFTNGIPVDSIWIYETYNAGAVDTVYVKNPNTNQWVTVYSGAAGLIASSRIFKIGFPMTSFNVSEVRIAVNSPAVTGWNEIDAVAVVSSSLPNNVSLHDSSFENAIEVFPNPSSGQMTVQVNHPFNKAFVKLYSITGQILMEENNILGNNFTFDISQEPSGIYFLEIKQDGNVSRIKLVKEE